MFGTAQQAGGPKSFLSVAALSKLQFQSASPGYSGPQIIMNIPRNWKSAMLLVSISTLGLLLLCSALISTVKLPFLTRAGLGSWLVLLVLTVVASRFTVSITTNLGAHKSRKSVADSLVFLAVIL